MLLQVNLGSVQHCQPILSCSFVLMPAVRANLNNFTCLVIPNLVWAWELYTGTPKELYTGTHKEQYTGTPNSDIHKLCTVLCGRNVNKPSVYVRSSQHHKKLSNFDLIHIEFHIPKRYPQMWTHLWIRWLLKSNFYTPFLKMKHLKERCVPTFFTHLLLHTPIFKMSHHKDRCVLIWG